VIVHSLNNIGTIEMLAGLPKGGRSWYTAWKSLNSRD
jgi:hypothetical protein